MRATSQKDATNKTRNLIYCRSDSAKTITIYFFYIPAS